MKVSLCENLKNPTIIGYDSVDGIINRIIQGFTKNNVQSARIAGKGTPIFEQLKASTTTWTPNACFETHRRKDCLDELSGFIYLDIDSEIDFKTIEDIPFIYACWASFSGSGYGLLAKTDNLNLFNFNHIWAHIDEYFKIRDIFIDPQTKDISRQNVISYDPKLYRNPNCIPLDADDIVSDSTLSTFHYHSTFTGYPTSNTSTISTGTTYPSFNLNIGNSELIYKTELDGYNGKDYIVIEEGKAYRDCYVPKTVADGMRHRWLAGRIISLLFNNPDISYENLLGNILFVNKYHMDPPKKRSEVVDLVKFLYKEHLHGTLNYNPKMKKIWINPDANLSTREKKQIIGKERGRLQREKTIRTLQSCYNNLKKSNSRITQKMLATKSGFHINTVKKRWKNLIK